MFEPFVLVEAKAAFRQAQGERILKLHEAGSITVTASAGIVVKKNRKRPAGRSKGKKPKRKRIKGQSVKG